MSAKSREMTTYDPHQVDASLDDFHALPTPPPTLPPSFIRYPSQRSGFAQSSMHTDDLDQESVTSDLMDAASSLSGGGYSPPAWRRMGNGDRDFGSWRRSDGGGNPMGLGFGRPDWQQQHHYDDGLIDDEDVAENDDVLRRAIRTRLPTGSLSPEKGRTPEPGADEDDTLVKLKSIDGSPVKSIKNDAHRRSMMASMSPDTAKDNCKFLSQCDWPH